MVSGPRYPGSLTDYAPRHTDEAIQDLGYGLPRIYLPKLFGEYLKASRPCVFSAKRRSTPLRPLDLLPEN
jgi:hypothetical protein